MILAILVPLFLVLAFYISKRADNALPEYSVINKSRGGCSIYFETLQEFKYPVKRVLAEVKSIDIKDIQIMADSTTFNVNSNEIKNWVRKGGTLVYLSRNDIPLQEYGMPEIEENITVYKYGEGVIIKLNGYHLTNKALAKNTDVAYELLGEMHKYKFKNIYFNEKYLYSGEVKESLWDYIPIGYKFIAYQFILALIALFLYKGRRFGKVVPLYEETERDENEYLHSAAGLYKQAKSFDLMFEIYYKRFIKKMNCNEDVWLNYWKEQNLPQYSKAKTIYEFANSSKKKYKNKEYIKIIAIIDELTEVLVKRREIQWKDLKKTL